MHPHGQQDRENQVFDPQRRRERRDARHGESPPASHAEIVLALDDERVKNADNEKGRRADDDSHEMICLQKFHHVDKDSASRVQNQIYLGFAEAQPI